MKQVSQHYIHAFVKMRFNFQFQSDFVYFTHAPDAAQSMESNWKNARHTLTRIECHSENSKGVYCLQYDDHKIISGLRDNTIKVCIYTTHPSIVVDGEGKCSVLTGKETSQQRIDHWVTCYSHW